MAGAFAVAELFLVGCAPATSESREASSLLEVEACFTLTVPENPDNPALIKIIWDGSSSIWQTTLRTGKTRCLHSQNVSNMTGYLRFADAGEEFPFQFNNPNFGYPHALLINRPLESWKTSGPGVCQGFAAGESKVLDYGTYRLFIERKTDSEYKRFNVIVSPSEGTTTMDTCNLF